MSKDIGRDRGLVMSLLVCPFCKSEDIEVDEDYVIVSCPFCAESEGYRAELLDEDLYL